MCGFFVVVLVFCFVLEVVCFGGFFCCCCFWIFCLVKSKNEKVKIYSVAQITKGFFCTSSQTQSLLLIKAKNRSGGQIHCR